MSSRTFFAREPLKLNPDDSSTFIGENAVLQNKLIHSTSTHACSSILKHADRAEWKGSIPVSEGYDGFDDVARTNTLRKRTHFEVRHASEMLLFPFSRYPKDVPVGTNIRMMLVDADVLLDDKYVMYYAASTPTRFGGRFMTVYQTHIVVACRGSPEQKFAETCGFYELDKFSNCVIHFSERKREGARVASRIRIDGHEFPHSISLGFLGGLTVHDKSAVEVRKATKIGVVSGSFICPVNTCTTKYASLSNLKSHYLAVHTPPTTTLFPCEVCSKRFKTRSLLNSHLISHRSSNYECVHCKSSFKSKPLLVRHLQIVHFKEELPHKCTQCNLAFVSRANLQQHVKGVHLNERKHVCTHDSCGQKFLSASSLRAHINSVHLGAKDFCCDTCGRKFSVRSNLTRHVATVHALQKRHVCIVCPRKYSSKASLKRHMTTAHANEVPNHVRV